jgi:hypothetical protein
MSYGQTEGEMSDHSIDMAVTKKSAIPSFRAQRELKIGGAKSKSQS